MRFVRVQTVRVSDGILATTACGWPDKAESRRACFAHITHYQKSREDIDCGQNLTDQTAGGEYRSRGIQASRSTWESPRMATASCLTRFGILFRAEENIDKFKARTGAIFGHTTQRPVDSTAAQGRSSCVESLPTAAFSR